MGGGGAAIEDMNVKCEGNTPDPGEVGSQSEVASGATLTILAVIFFFFAP